MIFAARGSFQIICSLFHQVGNMASGKAVLRQSQTIFNDSDLYGHYGVLVQFRDKPSETNHLKCVRIKFYIGVSEYRTADITWPPICQWSSRNSFIPGIMSFSNQNIEMQVIHWCTYLRVRGFSGNNLLVNKKRPSLFYKTIPATERSICSAFAGFVCLKNRSYIGRTVCLPI